MNTSRKKNSIHLNLRENHAPHSGGSAGLHDSTRRNGRRLSRVGSGRLTTLRRGHGRPRAGKALSPWLPILGVLGVFVLFFGFTDMIRVSEASFPLFAGFLALLGVVMLIAVHRRKGSV